MPQDLDACDVALFGALQRDARLTVAQLAEKVNLSTSPTWRRVKRLEDEGVIAGSSDFLLQIVGRDLDTYAEFAMTTVRRLPGIRAMQTIFTLKEVKPPAPWPIPGPR